MTPSTMKTQDKQDVLQEARKAAALMERLVIQYKDEPNWLEIVAAEYKEEISKQNDGTDRAFSSDNHQ